MDLPVWQALHLELAPKGLVILAVATDDADAARPHIEAAEASYPCLVDPDHRVAALYNLVNVPQAVWIDERGRIVRPAETAGAHDGFRRMNRETGAMPEEEMEQTQKLRAFYLDAIRDWVAKGESSEYAFSDAEAKAHLTLPEGAVARAAACFLLGRWLLRAGRGEEGQRRLAEAVDLHPESWSYWRQAGEKNEMGFAAGAGFWERVDALGERRYYQPPDSKGLPC